MVLQYYFSKPVAVHASYLRMALAATVGMMQSMGSMLDATIRLGYRWAHRVLRVWWYVRRPRTHGSAVALWHQDVILLVRTSYRGCYCLPGGFVRRGEPSEQAARRELREELGIDLPAGALRHAWHGTIHFESKADAIDIWEAVLDQPPAVRVTGREIVWAGWMDPRVALGRRLLPHMIDYLARHCEADGAGR
jgi:8-oxo-dGTP diphosphatase